MAFHSPHPPILPLSLRSLQPSPAQRGSGPVGYIRATMCDGTFQTRQIPSVMNLPRAVRGGRKTRPDLSRAVEERARLLPQFPIEIQARSCQFNIYAASWENFRSGDGRQCPPPHPPATRYRTFPLLPPPPPPPPSSPLNPTPPQNPSSLRAVFKLHAAENFIIRKHCDSLPILRSHRET